MEMEKEMRPRACLLAGWLARIGWLLFYPILSCPVLVTSFTPWWVPSGDASCRIHHLPAHLTRCKSTRSWLSGASRDASSLDRPLSTFMKHP